MEEERRPLLQIERDGSPDGPLPYLEQEEHSVPETGRGNNGELPRGPNQFQL